MCARHCPGLRLEIRVLNRSEIKVSLFLSFVCVCWGGGAKIASLCVCCISSQTFGILLQFRF